MVLDTLDAIVGASLLFFLPGAGIARALFPEWRFTGPLGRLRAVETVTLAFLTSVSLTILVGSALTTNASGPFPASWSNPLLEAILALVAAVGFLAAYGRGAFRRGTPEPLGPAVAARSPDEILRELAVIRTEERRLRHRLRVGSLSEGERTSTTDQLEALRSRTSQIERDQEAAIARS